MKKMKRSMWLVCGLLAAVSAGPVIAGDMIPDAAGKTGLFTTKLKSECNESEREAILKRMSLTGYAKHDLAMTPYDIYVPKEPGKDGKYGLIVCQNFREYGKPPTSWEAVLEKYHLIWIGPQGVTDGSPALMRVAYTLDAVYNAENTWSIDMSRVYLFNCSKDHPGADLALYYPDVFTASINCSQFQWFHRLANSKTKGFNWDFPPMPKPDAEMVKLAKTRKFVLVDRSEDKVTDLDNDVASGGYVKDGYTLAKILSVKTNIAQKYLEMVPDWFELSLGYIEGASGPATKPAGTAATTQPAVAIIPSVSLTGATAEVAAAPTPEPTPKTPTPSAPVTPNGKPAATASKPAAPAVVVPQVSAEDVAEEKATKTLNLARTYWAAGKNDIAKTKLEQLLKLYPKTNAAKDAKTLLGQINAQP